MSSVSIEIETILGLPKPEQELKALSFIQSHPLLLEHPVSNNSLDLHASIVRLCSKMAENNEQDNKPDQAIIWYKKCEPIMRQSAELERTFCEVYIRLALCCLRLFQFADGLRYLNYFERLKTGNVLKMLCPRVVRASKNTLLWYMEHQDSIRVAENEILFDSKARPDFHVKVASFYAGIYYEDGAVKHLQLALKNGFKDLAVIIEDEFLRGLIKTEQFKEAYKNYFEGR